MRPDLLLSLRSLIVHSRQESFPAFRALGFKHGLHRLDSLVFNESAQEPAFGHGFLPRLPMRAHRQPERRVVLNHGLDAGQTATAIDPLVVQRLDRIVLS